MVGTWTSPSEQTLKWRRKQRVKDKQTNQQFDCRQQLLKDVILAIFNRDFSPKDPSVFTFKAFSKESVKKCLRPRECFRVVYNSCAHNTYMRIEETLYSSVPNFHCLYPNIASPPF